MLDTLYRQLFHPQDAPPSEEAAVLVSLMVVVVMTFNAAANLQVSAGGVGSLLILFALGGFLGVFWFAAALLTLSSLSGSTTSFQSLLPAILVGLWPLMFAGAAMSARQGIPALGALLSLAIILGTGITLARSLVTVQSISLWQALLLIFATLLLSVLAIGGIIVWPLMLLLGL